MSEDKLLKLRKDAVELLRTGINAVTPENLFPNYISLKNNILKICDIKGANESYRLDKFNEIIVIGAGKASTLMAKKIENILGDRITKGLVVTKYDHSKELKKIQSLGASHPLPDKNSNEGSKKIINLCKDAGNSTLIINLISGGASSLLSLPVGKITLPDKIKTNELLIKSGMTIREINIIRKHISSIKGGRLAEYAYPAPIINIIISDVIGDDLETIGSGFTVPDSSTFKDSWEILLKYNLVKSIPQTVKSHIKNGMEGLIDDTPKPGNKIFHNVNSFIIGNNKIALSAILKASKKKGYSSKIIMNDLTGKVKDAAKKISETLNKSVLSKNKTRCFIFGGETEVIVKGKGKGGRNQELCLHFAKEIYERKNTVFLSAGTDGTDGDTDAAGAVCDGSTIYRALKQGLNTDDFLIDNDSYNFFEQLGDLIITGPTGTNVIDIQLLLID